MGKTDGKRMKENYKKPHENLQPSPKSRPSNERVQAAIERFDESLFGVNVDFGAMKVTVSEGVVVIHDLTIENPAGYWSTHFLHIGELLIDLDLQSFITSMGKEVVIQRLELRDVEVIWEGGLVSSNMRDILKCMSGPKDDSNQSDKNRQKEGGERRTSVQEVLAQDISLKLASYWFCGSGPRIMVEDFYSQNLDEHQMGELEIPQCLLTMLLSSILANVLGQSIARFIMDGTSFGFAAVAHGIWHLVVLMRSACCCPPSPTKRDRPSRPKRPRAETERGSSTGTCGSCGSCLPCETLLQKKPAAKPSGNT
ncbi:Uncharacterized protein SCF082_LOCUS1960 [Durusdinium trenchii]|uniref:Uncharacterized protein n=1 Tax=Durusdinium trenchii TaxID=1381693 RepID=A0ABP0HHY3_9DINO